MDNTVIPPATPAPTDPAAAPTTSVPPTPTSPAPTVAPASPTDFLTEKQHPEDLASTWRRTKCLKCGYLHEGSELLTECPKCGNTDKDKLMEAD